MSSVTLSSHDGVIGGIVFSANGVYTVRFVGDDIHEIAQVDQSRFPREAPPRQRPPRESASASARPDQDVGAQADDGTTIDVLVLYTPAARTNAGGLSGIMTRINTSVALTNTSYVNSLVTQQLRLVGAQEVSYAENVDIGIDLDCLSLDVPSPMGEQAKSLRNSLGADIVTLLTSGRSGPSLRHWLSPNLDFRSERRPEQRGLQCGRAKVFSHQPFLLSRTWAQYGSAPRLVCRRRHYAVYVCARPCQHVRARSYHDGLR